MRRFVKPVLLTVLAVGLVIQLVPYGWRHSNPPVTQDAPWPSAETRDIAVSACYDCHSNETEWPVYSYAAPMSWLVRRDVEGGRDELNFSTWDQGEQEAHDAADAVEEGSMPPRQYRLLHPNARLSDDEEQTLIAALQAMEDGGDNGGHGGGDDGDRSGSNSGPG